MTLSHLALLCAALAPLALSRTVRADTPPRVGTTRAWTDADRKYSEAMMGYWLAFARTGDPNAEGLPPWPAYKPDSEQVMLFGAEIKPGVLPNRPQLDFFAHQHN